MVYMPQPASFHELILRCRTTTAWRPLSKDQATIRMGNGSLTTNGIAPQSNGIEKQAASTMFVIMKLVSRVIMPIATLAAADECARQRAR